MGRPFPSAGLEEQKGTVKIVSHTYFPLLLLPSAYLMDWDPPAGEDPPLSPVLQDALGPRPSRRAAKALVARCHRMARAYLRKRRRSGHLREDVLGEDVDDLAIDAIGELFERDEQGRFPELRRYFRSRFEATSFEGALQEAIRDASGEELQRSLRRLVWSAVGDWLFEAYRTADRSLSNQLRALKRAVKDSDKVDLVRRQGEQWIMVGSRNANGDRGADNGGKGISKGRQMPIETMEAHLAGAVAEARSAADLLRRAAQALRAHRAFESAYPVVRLAQAMRAAQARVNAGAETGDSVGAARSEPADMPLRPEKVVRLIVETARWIYKQKRPTYVEPGKISAETFQAYVRALRSRLAAKYVPEGRLLKRPLSEESVSDEGAPEPERAAEERKGADRSESEGADTAGVQAHPAGLSLNANGHQSHGRGGPERSQTHYEALSSELRGLSKETYRDEHRARFEYLFQEAETRLTERLRDVVDGATEDGD
mgnify:CR=1 FL=1